MRLLSDSEPQVRRAAAGAAGKLKEPQAIEPLLKLASDPDAMVRRASLDALHLLNEPRAIPLAVAALRDTGTEQTALATLRDLGGPDQCDAVTNLAKRNPSLDVLVAAVQALTVWRDRTSTTAEQRQKLDRAAAEIQGASGSLLRWAVSIPEAPVDEFDNQAARRKTQFATGIEGRLVVAAKGAAAGTTYQAQTDIAVSQPAEVEFLGSSSGSIQVLLNGKSIYDREKPQPFRIDSDRASASLKSGINHLAVNVTGQSADSPVEFHLRFRRKSELAEHERLLQSALTRAGNLERGRDLLLNIEKSQCLKCHRLGDQGERTGPELTGLGNRFSRIYIAESILQPSRTIAPSFETVDVILASGRIVSGVKVAESEIMLTLVDKDGVKQPIAKADVEDRRASTLSTMPEGLEKRLTEQEFVDLVAFLVSLKESPVP